MSSEIDKKKKQLIKKRIQNKRNCNDKNDD
jgi:hypothetical protein